MNPSTWERLESEFQALPILQGGAVTIGEIESAEALLGRSFPDDYRSLILRFGAAIVGPYPIFGLRPVQPMGNDWNVVKMNDRFRQGRWPGIS